VPFRISAIAIFPFIFIRKERRDDQKLINHERIHIRQQIELLFVGFILIYYIEMLFKGYRNISFEKEAYENETNLNYLKGKSFWSFSNYFSKPS
jgi:hypothetical protein